MNIEDKVLSIVSDELKVDKKKISKDLGDRDLAEWYSLAGSLHHLAWEAKNFEESVNEMNLNLFRQITRVEKGFEGRKVVFFLPRNGLRNPLIEIISKIDNH